jgi:hypothetical protein
VPLSSNETTTSQELFQTSLGSYRIITKSSDHGSPNIIFFKAGVRGGGSQLFLGREHAVLKQQHDCFSSIVVGHILKDTSFEMGLVGSSPTVDFTHSLVEQQWQERTALIRKRV